MPAVSLIMLDVRTIAVLNQKGGVGKTTTVVNLGAAIASTGRKVCLLDLDPQANLTLHLGIEPGVPELGTYDVLVSGAPIDQASVQVAENLTVIGSEIDLAAAEVELVTAVGREQILRDALHSHGPDCDYVLIDCPPSLGLLTLNALAAADDVFIPLQPHFLALQGMGKLLETVQLVQQRINPSLKVSGVILCMYETATRLAGEVEDDLRGFFESSCDTNMPWSQAKIFDTVIRRNVKLAECPSHGQSIFQYEPNSNGANDYHKLTEEVLNLLEPEELPADISESPDAADADAEPTVDELVDEAVDEQPAQGISDLYDDVVFGEAEVACDEEMPTASIGQATPDEPEIKTDTAMSETSAVSAESPISPEAPRLDMS